VSHLVKQKEKQDLMMGKTKEVEEWACDSPKKAKNNEE
jgi:hypothetical protein